MQELRAFLGAELTAGRRFFPPADKVFNALSLTPFEDVRVVILGQDPYHGPGQAMGLCSRSPQACRSRPPSGTSTTSSRATSASHARERRSDAVGRARRAAPERGADGAPARRPLTPERAGSASPTARSASCPSAATASSSSSGAATPSRRARWSTARGTTSSRPRIRHRSALRERLPRLPPLLAGKRPARDGGPRAGRLAAPVESVLVERREGVGEVAGLTWTRAFPSPTAGHLDPAVVPDPVHVRAESSGLLGEAPLRDLEHALERVGRTRAVDHAVQQHVAERHGNEHAAAEVALSPVKRSMVSGRRSARLAVKNERPVTAVKRPSGSSSTTSAPISPEMPSSARRLSRPCSIIRETSPCAASSSWGSVATESGRSSASTSSSPGCDLPRIAEAAVVTVIARVDDAHVEPRHELALGQVSPGRAEASSRAGRGRRSGRADSSSS